MDEFISETQLPVLSIRGTNSLPSLTSLSIGMFILDITSEYEYSLNRRGVARLVVFREQTGSKIR
jgi:hypothetical protein